MAEARIPGLSIALVERGRVVWVAAYGVESAKTGAPVTEDSVFEAASLSKPVFTLVMLDAVQRDLIDLDAPISGYFAYDRFAPDGRADRITPRMVLSHQTGLPNWDRDGALDFDRDPGIRYGYSGEGFVFLQKALEAKTGRRLEDLARELVFEPYGMADSSFLWRDGYAARLASGHGAEGEPRARNQYSEENAAYSLVTSARDYGAFLVQLMGGANLDWTLYDQMLAIHTSMQGDETRSEKPPEVWRAMHWGLGWGIQEMAGNRIYFHWGDNDTYQAFAAFSPADDVGFVYFANSQNGLKIAGHLALLAVGDMTAALEWLGYDQL